MEHSATLDDLERALSAVVRLLADRATVEDVAQRSGHDLPPASWTLLEHLDARGPLRVSDIAVCHGVDISSITPRLKSLETIGLVARERESTDARAFRISITSAGIAALESVHAARREILAGAVGDIGTPQLMTTAKVLAHLSQQLMAHPVLVN